MMTVDGYQYSHSAVNQFQQEMPLRSVKNILTVTTKSAEYYSDEEGDERGEGEVAAADELPALVHDGEDEERDQLMRLVVKIITRSLCARTSCQCCNEPDVGKILLNLLSITRFNMWSFLKVYSTAVHHCNGTDCVKFIVLADFIHTSTMSNSGWSDKLSMPLATISRICARYQPVTVNRNELMVLKNELSSLVQSHVRPVQ